MGDESERMSKSDPMGGERGHYRQRAKVHMGDQDGSRNSK